MDDTPNLGLPYIMAAQSQKHVTHNEAIRALDALVQLSVLDRDLAAPPGSPADGARYIVAVSPTGAWSGHAGDIAAYQDGTWAFYVPLEGFMAWVADEDAAVVWSGSAWTALTTGSGGAGSFSTVGVNATADATNKLSVAAAATLLNHAGAGHQLKINKAAASDTASLLYQDAFSGRAELGLTGDDDFHFKVSADGSTWKEAIVIDSSTGVATFPLTPRREVLAANRTYYVRSDGSDSNNGLANTSGDAFLTWQKAIDAVATLDLSIFNATIQIGDGTYTGAVVVNGPWVGSGTVTILGNTGTPANVVINKTSGDAITVKNGGTLTVSGFTVRTTTSGQGLRAQEGGATTIGASMVFGACVNNHIYLENGGRVFCRSSYTINGSAGCHVQGVNNAVADIAGITVTLSGTPAFSSSYAYAGSGAVLQLHATTFSGSATGSRYTATALGVVFVGGAGTSYLPGNAAGTGTSPGTSPYGLYL